MRWLKALLRRRSNDEQTPVTTDTYEARRRTPRIQKHPKYPKNRLNVGNTIASPNLATGQKYDSNCNSTANSPNKTPLPHQPMNIVPGIREQTDLSHSPPEVGSEPDRGVSHGSEMGTPMDEESSSPAKGEINDCVKSQSSPISGNAIPSLSNTVDTDKTTSYAQAITHETVRPHIHEIKEEQIYRDTHTHDVYHRIQPVSDIEVLPARHFVLGSNSALVEVPEGDLPECTGLNQKWYIGEKPPRIASSSSENH
ncbi:hypothetical protein F4781DRAFT_439324 [Annulohypoxylon bovei var. microspora]|nr:hypothetical protein F4781DRAFT_439324 [Annulohypoxylon bovei var. microspora]